MWSLRSSAYALIVRMTIGVSLMLVVALGLPGLTLPTSADAVPSLRPRAPEPKRLLSRLPRGVHGDAIVLKMAEGSHVRMRDGKLRMLGELITPGEGERLSRLGLTPEAVEADLETLNLMVATDWRLSISRITELDEDIFDQMKAFGEQSTQEELADVNLYYLVRLDKEVKPKQAVDFVNTFNSLAAVEFAAFVPIGYDAAGDIPPTTEDLNVNPDTVQDYLGPASVASGMGVGIDAQFAWTVNGGTGENVKIYEIEKGWHLDHEDLPEARAYLPGAGIHYGTGEHGTAVFGMLVSQPNQYGVRGICPDARVGAVSNFPLFGFGALLYATASIGRGDIILIEQQYFGPSSGLTCVENCTQFEMVAVEDFRLDFDVIRLATSNNQIVVEGAGNGSMNLDSPIYRGNFNRFGPRGDSGAIMVGAGRPRDGIYPSDGAFHIALSTEVWSNAGSRVDLQGGGEEVVTTGYGDAVRGDGGDVRQFYTNTFSGTSSASPMVAGAAACINGVIRFNSGTPLNSFQMRALLGTTGTSPAALDARNIGRLPNIRAALTAIGAMPAPIPTWGTIPNTILNSAPEVIATPLGRLVALGIGTDGNLFHSTQARRGGDFGPWTRIGSPDVRLVGRLSALLNRDGRMEVFARGADGNLYHAWHTSPDGDWSDVTRLGLAGGFTSDPAAAVNEDGRLEVFIRGGDLQLYHTYQSRHLPVIGGFLWISHSESLGGSLAGAPAAARNADGTLQVFARFADGSIRTIQQGSPNEPFGAWTDFGFTATADPTAIAIGGMIQVFARGTDNTIWHRGAALSGFGSWTRIELGTVSAVATGARAAAALDATGMLVMAVRDESRHIHFARLGATWTALTPLGSNLASDPALAMNGGALQAFATGTNRVLALRNVP
jgi:serine protease